MSFVSAFRCKVTASGGSGFACCSWNVRKTGGESSEKIHDLRHTVKASTSDDVRLRRIPMTNGSQPRNFPFCLESNVLLAQHKWKLLSHIFEQIVLCQRLQSPLPCFEHEVMKC